MEEHIRDARDCGRDMFNDGLAIAHNPFVMSFQTKEKEAWIDGYKEAQNAANDKS